MIKHTIEIAERPASLSLRQKQLVVRLEENARSFSCEDVGVIVLQHPAISLSAAVLNALLESGAVVVVCGENRLPTGILLPTVTHTELVPRMVAQMTAPLPARKRLWRFIVQAKILEQASRLSDPHRRRLEYLAKSVKSGDPENVEGQAARVYWAARFPEQYNSGDKRDPNSNSFFNSALNYGYAIIRAAVARALVSAGMQPALGIYHSRRNNPFCLADDLMEPLRPMVDDVVLEMIREPFQLDGRLEQEHRRRLLSVLSKNVCFHTFEGPLFVTLSRYVNNFFEVLTGKEKTLSIPRPCLSTGTDVCG